MAEQSLKSDMQGQAHLQTDRSQHTDQSLPRVCPFLDRQKKSSLPFLFSADTQTNSDNGDKEP